MSWKCPCAFHTFVKEGKGQVYSAFVGSIGMFGDKKFIAAVMERGDLAEGTCVYFIDMSLDFVSP